MANLDGSGLSEVWVRAAQLVKRFTGAVNLTKGDLQTQVDTKITGTAISSSSAITTQGEYALDAREKNASVEGTLANQISTLNSNLNAMAPYNSTHLGGLAGKDKLSINTSQYKFVYFIFNDKYVTDTFSISAINKHHGFRKTYTVDNGYDFSINPYIDSNKQLSVDLKMTGYSSGGVSVYAIK